jgi:hypothetical protein
MQNKVPFQAHVVRTDRNSCLVGVSPLPIIKCRQARVQFPIFKAGENFHFLFTTLRVNNEPTDAYSTSSLYYVLLIAADL